MPILPSAAAAALTIALLAGPSACQLPEAPEAFLALYAQSRAVTVVKGSPEHVGLFDPFTGHSDLPDLLSSCRRTPVTLTGEDPVDHAPRPVELNDYALPGSDPSRLRTVLLLPPTGGENPVDDAFAKSLCEKGIRVVLLQHWKADSDSELDLGMHDRGTLRAAAAMEDVVTYIHPAMPTQLGVLGTSVGGISGALLLGTDPRVSAGVIIVGGGGMAEIIAASQEKSLTDLRTERMAKFGFHDQAEYEAALAKEIKIEPLDFVNFSKEKKVLFFMALQDTTVPTPNQEKLYKAFGSQELVTYAADHFHTILHTGLADKQKIASFFLQNLAEPSEAARKDAPPEQAGPPAEQDNLLCRNARTSLPAPTGP